MYGSANKFVFVWKCKKTDYHEHAKVVTTTHYFVNGNRRVVVNRSSETTNIGFSVVAKVGVCDGTYGIIVEGPKQHPVSALLCMFDQVNRIGI